MSDVNRRYFLMSSGLAAAAPLAARASSPNGANNRVRVAIRGCRLDGRLRPPELVEVLVVEATDERISRR